MMDIHKLEIFIDLSETLNYTETAERKYTTQSNISKQIISLETELGTPLFERTHRKIILNSSGQLILPHAKELVNHFYKMKEDLYEQKNKEELSLNILTIPTLANYQGFELITQFFKDHPEFLFYLKEGEGNQLFPFLKDNKNNLIFARTFEKEIAGFESLVTEEDNFVVAVSKKHLLSENKLINLIELKEEKFVVLEEDTQLYQPTIELCNEAKFTPKIIFKSARIDLLLNMVENELGICILMEKSIDKYWKQRLKIIPVTPTKTSYLSFIRKKDKYSKANQILWQYLEAALKQ